MPAKKSKMKLKPASKPAKKSKAPPAAPEPETLNEATVATDAMPADKPARRRRPEKELRALDKLETMLAVEEGPIALQYAIVTTYGDAWTPERELDVLQLLKDDGRFVVATRDHQNVVSLASAGPQQSTLDKILERVDEVLAEKPAPTLGDAVEKAKRQTQRIAWPHQIGSSVLLLTDGYEPSKGQLRNIHDHGAYVLYDLNIDGGVIEGVPASRIGRDLDAEGEIAQMRKHIALLERHRARGRELAQQHVEMIAEDKRMAEVLKKHRERTQEVASELADHARADSENGDAVQTDLRDVVNEPAPGPSRGAKLAAPPAAAEDKLADAPAAPAEEPVAVEKDPMPQTEAGVMTLEQADLSFEELMASRFEQATSSTGKPQVVKPITPMVNTADGDFPSHGAHVVVDVQDGKAVLVAVYGKAEWKKVMAYEFGEPLTLPFEEQSEQLAKGGRWCGIPVKVGRATCYLGAEQHALLVRLPPEEAEPEKLTGKDAAAGR